MPVFNFSKKKSFWDRLYMKAIGKRNAVYSVACPRLTPPAVEKLGQEEVAWVKFTSEEHALMDNLQSENHVSEKLADAHNIDVVEARTNHLQAFFVDHKIDYPVQYTPQNRDQELNRVYAECFRRMTESDQRLLVSSERAWLTYRDADIAVLAANGSDQGWSDTAIVDLTVMRSGQLASIVQSLSQLPITDTPAQELTSPPLQNSSPNPEDVKALAEFQNDTKAVLNALLAKKDDPFFKKADVIKNMPELPSEISDRITKLDAQYVELLQKPDSDKLLEPALHECRAVELMASWSKFTQQMKAGRLVDAGFTIKRALSQKAADATDDYLPLWQTVGSWQDVFVIDESKYFEHIRNADRLSDLGKDFAAIKEYQAAYDIIENPIIPVQIKKLREQSLGL